MGTLRHGLGAKIFDPLTFYFPQISPQGLGATAKPPEISSTSGLINS